MNLWDTSSLTWINLGGDLWVRVDQIEGVWRDSRRRVIVKAVSGQEYVVEGLSVKDVLARMTKKEEQS